MLAGYSENFKYGRPKPLEFDLLFLHARPKKMQ